MITKYTDLHPHEQIADVKGVPPPKGVVFLKSQAKHRISQFYTALLEQTFKAACNYRKSKMAQSTSTEHKETFV